MTAEYLNCLVQLCISFTVLFFQTYVNLKQYDHSLYADVNDLKAMRLYSCYWAEGSHHKLTNQPNFCLLGLLLLLLFLLLILLLLLLVVVGVIVVVAVVV